jgi:hypothetical protein
VGGRLREEVDDFDYARANARQNGRRGGRQAADSSITGANANNATLYDNLNFNFIRDIAPIGFIEQIPLVMAAIEQSLIMSATLGVGVFGISLLFKPLHFAHWTHQFRTSSMIYQKTTSAQTKMNTPISVMIPILVPHSWAFTRYMSFEGLKPNCASARGTMPAPR